MSIPQVFFETNTRINALIISKAIYPITKPYKLLKPRIAMNATNNVNTLGVYTRNMYFPMWWPTAWLAGPNPAVIISKMTDAYIIAENG